MSVAIYSEAELNGLYKAMIENGAEAERVKLALTCAAYANRMAYSRTYNEKVDMPQDFTIGMTWYNPVPDWTLYQWVRNLLYNCVSNGGTDFCPPVTREWLETTSKTPRFSAAKPKPVIVPKPADNPRRDWNVNDWTKAIKQALSKRSKTRFSVTHGTGTGYGWIRISVAKASKTPEVDAAELRALLGSDSTFAESFSVAASNAYREEYLARAEGRTPTTYGTPYWD